MNQKRLLVGVVLVGLGLGGMYLFIARRPSITSASLPAEPVEWNAENSETTLRDSSSAEPEKRAALYQLLMHQTPSAIGLARDYLLTTHDAQAFTQLLIETSLEVPPDYGRMILDDVLGVQKNLEVEGRRLVARSRLDAQGSLPALERLALNPKLTSPDIKSAIRLRLFEVSPKAVVTSASLLSDLSAESVSDLTKIHILQRLLENPAHQTDALLKARTLLLNKQASPDLRSAIFRILQVRNDESLTETVVERLLASTNEAGRAQIARSLTFRCARDRAKILSSLRQDTSPIVQNAVKAANLELEKHDPCPKAR